MPRSPGARLTACPDIPVEPRVAPSRLADETFVDFPPGWATGWRSTVRSFAVADPDRQVPFEVADYASAADLVRHG